MSKNWLVSDDDDDDYEDYDNELVMVKNIEGSRAEWCISSMIYSRDNTILVRPPPPPPPSPSPKEKIKAKARRKRRRMGGGYEGWDKEEREVIVSMMIDECY